MTISLFSLLAFAEFPAGLDKVTYGSLIKLVHHSTEYRLNSIGVNYASGSGQQVITSVPTAKDSNSYWMIRSGYSEEEQDIGRIVKCDDIIRLQHVNTQKHLHSHYQKSPVSQQQEVSGFGEENKDDNWQIKCQDKYWQRDDAVELYHVGTEKYLSTSDQHEFGNPIQGQLEIFAADSSTDSKWRASEGIYIGEEQEQVVDNDEL